MSAKNKSGEKLIETILDAHNIRFNRKKQMKLKKDTKKYRVPDFYLPDYNMVIEFFGSWIVPENKKFEERERKRFMEKVGAYHQSKIHTLYLYPTQLKDAEKLILKATKQISNLPTIYRTPLYWNIPWMKEKKIEKPSVTDFKKEEKLKEVVNEVHIEKKTTKHKVEITHEKPKHKVMVREAPVYDADFKQSKPVNNTFSNVLLFLTGIVVLLFVVYGLTVLSAAVELMDSAFYLFIFVTTILIILSAIYSIQRNIFHGFIIVGIIFLILLTIGLFMLGDNVWKLILTIIIILAVVPTEYYMINANKE